MTADEIAVDAFRLALDDSGLQKSDIDGLITCKSFGGHGIDTEIGRLAGLNPRFSATLEYGTCNFSLHLAAMAHRLGNGDHDRSRSTGPTSAAQATVSARLRAAVPDRSNCMDSTTLRDRGPWPSARHAYLYGTTEEQLGWVAVTERAHAQLNPAAIFRIPLTIEDYLREPYLVEPLRRSDICMISDGGACLIVTTSDRCRDCSNAARCTSSAWNR